MPSIACEDASTRGKYNYYCVIITNFEVCAPRSVLEKGLKLNGTRKDLKNSFNPHFKCKNVMYYHIHIESVF